MADAGFGELPPGKLLAGVELAAWRDIGMGKHALRWNVVAGDDSATEPDDRCDLPAGKTPIAELVPGIDDLDADGVRIDVGDASPRTLAGVPGAVAFAHHLHDAAVLMNKIMRGDLRFRRAEPRFRGSACLHAGIVQDDH